jgi:predicted ribosome quality control (RQC) complex YloA/Tae2 family protein
MARLRDYIFLILAVLFVPLAILGIIYAVSLKNDVRNLNDLNSRLLNEVTIQRQLSQKQHDLITKQLEVNQSQLSAAQQQLEVSRQLLSNSQDMDSKLGQSLVLQQQLLSTAQLTLQQAREINRKMPPSLQLASPAAQILP